MWWRAAWLVLAFGCAADPLARLSGEDAAAPDAAEPLDVEAPPPDAPADAGVAIDVGPEADAGFAPRVPPPLPRYSGGACPQLIHGPTSTTAVNARFPSGGVDRQFRLLVPRTYTATRAWPVMFAWHWLNASSGSFVRDGELESAIEEMGMIAVLPDKLLRPDGRKVYQFDWPFVEVSRAESELVFLDDMMACVTEQLSIDPERIYGIGVSAGALWMTYVSTSDRAKHFAAIESLSGGLGDVAGVWQMEYRPQAHKFPTLVLWGGPNDWLGVNFHRASMRYRDALLMDGHFVVECTHDSGHGMPPISPPNGSGTRFWALWRFMLDHPYSIERSPYAAGGLPAGFPDWCRIGGP